MERQGLIERIENIAKGTVDYVRTTKAREPQPALRLLGEWAYRHVEAEVALDDLNPDYLMWNVRRKIDASELPQRRIVVRFHFTDLCLPSLRLAGVTRARCAQFGANLGQLRVDAQIDDCLTTWRYSAQLWLKPLMLLIRSDLDLLLWRTVTLFVTSLSEHQACIRRQNRHLR
jgi:hypothetical protein